MKLYKYLPTELSLAYFGNASTHPLYQANSPDILFQGRGETAIKLPVRANIPTANCQNATGKGRKYLTNVIVSRPHSRTVRTLAAKFPGGAVTANTG